MSQPAVVVENLSKKYQIGAERGVCRYRTCREALTHAMMAPMRKLRAPRDGGRRDGTIWALRDVSFEVQPGEVIGIIGANGAGKSTLLKILCRITEPTEGRALVQGQVAPLLEVGTGFHPELTGRENIYLSGAIMGMTRREIRRKFDEIVAFAGVKGLIDTPVKRYSSGMYLRLAFAVAVHLEPEVLIVDEVLAVGDAQFQKRCLDKIQQIRHTARTILFVSHNLSAVRNICDRGIILENGRLVEQGEINAVTDAYIARSSYDQAHQELLETESFLVNAVQVQSKNGPVIKTFDPVEIRVTFTPKTDILDPGLYVGILSLENHRLTALDFKDFQTAPGIRAGQRRQLGFLIQELPLLPGSYQIELHLKDMAKYKIEMVPRTVRFDVVETPIYGGRKLDNWYGHVGLHARAMAPPPTSEPIQPPFRAVTISDEAVCLD
jgi:lipopolysaccharide transport system ATP-binding protein